MDVKSTWIPTRTSCFMVTWIVLKNPPLGGNPNTKPGNHGTLYTHNRWFILFYHVRGPAWMNIDRNITSGWWPNHVRLHTTLEGPWPHCTILEVWWDGRPLDTFLWGSHNFMVTALARVWSGPSSCWFPKDPWRDLSGEEVRGWNATNGRPACFLTN